ncbi:MAG: SDR family oxidoreductase [Proteobacteria bacterium]|nr:SDR family oxidoreductase [Pseudomonadota bacterium]MBU1708801.1 SDR family oxidoreductase [Pseudomonadota bacterium]
MNKIVLVTGGNSGIGFATARHFRDKGYTVYISGRDSGRVRDAAEKLKVKSIIADMSKLEDIEKMAAVFMETGLDVLVNNAAIPGLLPLHMATENAYSEVFNTNLRGPLDLIRQLIPALTKRQGCVINVSSIVVNNGLPNASLYAACKGGMDAFTRSLAREFAPLKIRVNAVSPGAIDTPIIHKLGLSEEEIEAVRAYHIATIPLGRFGLPEEVAHVIVSQAEASYVTGSVWNVDGGVDVC